MFLPNDSVHPIFCLFDHKASRAWALITSFEYQHNGKYKNRAFYRDFPNQEESLHFSDYRMSLDPMKALKMVSTHWAASCNIPRQGTTLNTTDSMSGEFAHADILSPINWGCRRVEFINVRNVLNCVSDCKTCLKQSSKYMLFVPMSCANNNRCSARTGGKENCFGYYGDINNNFGCVSTPTSLTQWWIGGPI